MVKDCGNNDNNNYYGVICINLELDECCYSYAFVPRNDTFCVPDEEQVTLICAIVNPHDNFTNLTVTWFRSTTEDMSTFDEIPTTSEGYTFFTFVSNEVDDSLSVINCSHELYIDRFSLTINSFTGQKNGYYWCQLSINDTLVQASHRAQFSVGECNIMNFYYRLAKFNLNENQCALYVATVADAGLTSTYKVSDTSDFSVTSLTESSTTSPSVTQQENETNKTFIHVATESDTESSTRLSSVTQQERESDKPITYVAGSLSALVLVFGALIIVLTILYLCKFRNREPSKSQSSMLVLAIN
jgi:hypothetical protein